MGFLHSIHLLEEQTIVTMKRNRQGKKWVNKVKRYGSFEGVLTKSERKQAEEFWQPYVGHINPLFHAWYKKTTGEFHPEFVPDNLWYTKIDFFFNNRKTGKVIDNKCLYEYFFSNTNLPVTICKRMNGMWFADKRILQNIGEVIEEVSNYESVFLKIANDSCGGRGVNYLTGKEIGNSIVQLDKEIKKDIVIQKPIVQSQILNNVNPSSVNTVRVLSLLRLDGVKIYSAVLRMGIGSSKVDNASSGGITCGILEDGRLKSVAYNKKGERFDQHPTTKINFDEIVIPNYAKIIDNTKQLALHFPMFRMVSWDWAVDEAGEPLLIEANLCDGELDFHQFNNGPIFGSDTEEILTEVFGAR